MLPRCKKLKEKHYFIIPSLFAYPSVEESERKQQSNTKLGEAQKSFTAAILLNVFSKLCIYFLDVRPELFIAKTIGRISDLLLLKEMAHNG